MGGTPSLGRHTSWAVNPLGRHLPADTPPDTPLGRDPLGRHPPGKTPPSRHTPQADTLLGREPLFRHPPRADNPLGRQPPLERHPLADTPPGRPPQRPPRQTSPHEQTPPRQTPRPEMATEAGGTHLTRMYSCFFVKSPNFSICNLL